MNKRAALKALARKRQRAHWPGYKNIGDYANGAYECPYVSPYTKTAGNLRSRIMVLLQDWSSDEALRRARRYHDDQMIRDEGFNRKLPTNRNLIKLVKDHFGLKLEDIYATNLFPFVKMGSISRRVSKPDMVKAAIEFTRPQIEIVRPKVVICLGHDVFNALRKAYKLPPIHPIASAIRSRFHQNGAWIWCQAHTGSRGQNNRNKGKKHVPTDWQRMAEAVAHLLK